VGNEVFDSMPVRLLHRIGGVWHERGVGVDSQGASVWVDRPTDLRPPFEVPGEHDYLTEIHPQAEAFVRTLAEHWQAGAGFFLDYGFPESEYYHPERHMGTLIAHRAHRSDDDVLADVGLKDITAHVNFTGVALAAQDAGLAVLGYTSQGRFLINTGLVEVAAQASARDQVLLQKLIHEHEMGELFKVLALAPAASAGGWSSMGFVHGDRSHRL
jgi:SAM-dependent MidA family methyltransferase